MLKGFISGVGSFNIVIVIIFENFSHMKKNNLSFLMS